MNRKEANTPLDEHKHGIRIHPVAEFTTAFSVKRDIRGVLKPPEASTPGGLAQGLEGSCMA